MAARAIWKGIIRFADTEVPVKLYSAIESQGVHFRLLHEKDLTPVSQQMVHPETGEIVDRSDVRKGYPVGRNQYVMLEPEDLDELEPESSRDITISRFVEPEEIDHRWYARAYFLGPDGEGGQYSALAEALRKKKKEGVAHWVMRNKEYVGSLREDEGHLMLIALRHAEEVVSAEDLEAPGGRDLEKREVAMAEQLVGALEGEFDPAAFTDEYRERVLEFVDNKAKGGKVKLKVLRQKATAEKSLADALEASLGQTRKKRASGG